MQRNHSLVDTARLFESLRDSGYKSPTSAIAELIDNAIDASANDIDLRLNLRANKPQEAEIVIVDNGTGMTPAEIVNSLRLGSGVKGGHRSALGRFGIGLTNAALSLGRRVEVYSWRTPRYVRMTRVDLDDVLSGLQDTVPMPVRVPWPADVEKETHKSGTMIRLCNLDRLNSRYVKPMQQNLSTEFGRVYRKHLTLGLTIRVNGKPIEAIDPMFLMPGSGIRGEKYGTTLVLPIRDDRTITTAPRLRRSVSILFSELPVERSSALSNHEKRSLGISKRSGVSILRGNREIDYGWFFMGRKRKENYDDWWRCQISFFPDLDELFGVNNTKQGIRPQRELVEVLTPHIEATAYKLNRRTRQKFAALRKVTKSATSSRIATQNDKFVPVPVGRSRTRHCCQRNIVRQLPHEIRYEEIGDGSLFKSSVSDEHVCTRINTLHPFGHTLQTIRNGGQTSRDLGAVELVELLLHAAARAEIGLNQSQFDQFKDQWAKVLNAYFS